GLPVVLLFMAIRLMRHPERTQVNGRISIGLTALTTAVAGLIAVASDLPSPPQWQDVFAAGGLLGWLAANPLSMWLTTWVTVPVLVLLAIFGLLVVTATPVAAIPQRIRQFLDWISGRDVDDDDAESAQPVQRRKRKAGSGPVPEI